MEPARRRIPAVPPAFGAIDLSGAGARLVGENEGELAGYNVSAAGDVNGDGFDGILVGAPWENGGAIRAGAAYLVQGRVYGVVDLSLADTKLK